MSRGIEKLQGHTIVCGMGRMGSILVRELAAAQRPFVVIDNDPQHVQALQDEGHLVLHGDASEEHVLELAGIRRAAVLATVLSDDAANVFITITARELNGQVTIIARGENPRTERKLLNCGANKVVLPTAIGAMRIGQLILRPTAETLLEQSAQLGDMNHQLGQIGLQFDELPVAASSRLVNRPLSDVELRCNHGFLIVGIRRADGTTIVNPGAETLLHGGDIVIVLGQKDDIPQLAERLSSTAQPIRYRGATVSS